MQDPNVMKFETKDLIVFGVTVCFFVLEAVIHYSIGKSSQIRGGHGRIRLILPSRRDMFKIVLVVIIFSALSSVTAVAINNIQNQD